MTIAPERPYSATEAARPENPNVVTRKVVPIKWWAALGAGVVGMIIYCWTDWIAVGDAHPAPKDGHAPGWMALTDHIFEGVVAALLLFTIYQFGWKQWRVQRRITLDGLLIMAMTSVYMLQDPWENYSAVVYSYNSRFVNLGCPQCHVPGWLSPGGSGKHQFVEPLIFIGLMYGGVLVLGMVGICKVMSMAKKRWPAIGTPGLIAVAFTAALILDLILELPGERGGGWVWWYPANNHLTLFYGHYYQMPLGEWLLWSGCWGSMGMLRYFRNDKGETFPERGLDKLKVTGWKRSGVRFLALAGALNLAMLCYNVSYNYVGLHSGTTIPAICNAPWYNDGMAGVGTDIHCPGPGIPIPSQQGTGYHLTPDNKLATPS